MDCDALDNSDFDAAETEANQRSEEAAKKIMKKFKH
jgi:hypothetical protein